MNVIVADTDADAIDEAKAYMPAFMEAQVRHYGAHSVDIAGIRGYEAWNATFEGWKRMCDPEQHPEVDGGADHRLGRHRAPAACRSSPTPASTTSSCTPSRPGAPRAVQHRWAERFAREVAPRFSPAFDPVGAR